MAWIESNQELGRHPKTKKLSRLLGVNLPSTVGHLMFLWWWALDFAQDGNLSNYDNDDLAEAMLYEGDSEFLVECLIKTGFLDESDNDLFIHDWDDYAGRLIEKREAKRAYDKERKRKRKEKLADESESEVNHKRFASESQVSHSESQVSHSESTMSRAFTVPNTTVPNTTVPNTFKDEKGKFQKPKENTEDTDIAFNVFWNEYPKQVAKKDAFKAWTKLKPNELLTEEIIQGIKGWKETNQWSKDEGQFIPYPATFLRHELWKNVPKFMNVNSFGGDTTLSDYELIINRRKKKSDLKNEGS